MEKGGCVCDDTTEGDVQMGRGPIQALTHSSQPACSTSAGSLCLLQHPSKITPPSRSQWGGSLVLEGGVCYVSVSVMELDAHPL